MIKNLILALAMTLAGTSLYAVDTKSNTVKKDKTHMFPKAKEGFVKYVIEVPKKANDTDHRVELLIGKKMLVDCNQHSLRAKIENVTLKGWGFIYLEVSDIHTGPSTMMACPQPKTEKFINIHMGEKALRRYNSRSPIVVYIQDGYQVRYRVWSADKTILDAKKR